MNPAIYTRLHLFAVGPRLPRQSNIKDSRNYTKSYNILIKHIMSNMVLGNISKNTEFKNGC